MKESTYQDSKNKSYTLKIREVQKELPEFCGEYFRSLSNMNMLLLAGVSLLRVFPGKSWN